MCGRFIQSADPDTWCEAFALASPAADQLRGIGPRYNLAPTQPVLAIRVQDSGRALVTLRFGLVPGWSRGPDARRSLINARAETVASKPAWRGAFRARRCLLPADGYYEWQAGAAGRQPYLIRRVDRAPFALAGLWERWQGPDGTVIESCAILTTTANARVAPVHDRMPVILSAAGYAPWLDPALREPDRLLPLLAPAPANGWELFPVSRRVNNPRHDGPELIEPLAA